jgi:hypothetical protein
MMLPPKVSRSTMAALFAVAMGFPHRVVDIEPGHRFTVIIMPGQQRHQAGQCDQESRRDGTQLPDVTEGECPQERAQRGRRLHPGQHLSAEGSLKSSNGRSRTLSV